MILLVLVLVAALNAYMPTSDAAEPKAAAEPALATCQPEPPPATLSQPADHKPKQAIGVLVTDDHFQFRLDCDFDEIDVPKGAAFIACDRCDVLTSPDKPSELRCGGPCLLRLADVVGTAESILCRRGEIVLTGGDQADASLRSTAENQAHLSIRAKQITISLFTGRLTAEGVEVQLKCGCPKAKR